MFARNKLDGKSNYEKRTLPSTLLDMRKVTSKSDTCFADNTIVSMYNFT